MSLTSVGSVPNTEAPSHSTGVSYARARLWLGISGVGTWVVLAIVALSVGLPSRFFATADVSLATALWQIAAFVGIYIAISAPFDLLGGFVLPRRYQRTNVAFASYLVLWTRGAFVHGLLLIGCGFLILIAAREYGTSGGASVFAILMLLMLAFQFRFAQLIGGISRASVTSDNILPQNAIVAANSDEGFVGGYTGWPGMETLVVPQHLIVRLSDSALQLQLTRRQQALATNSRTRGIVLAILWNLGGFLLAVTVSGSDLATVAGLVTTSLWFTIWSFIGLLLLPTPSRLGVIEVDQATHAAGADANNLEELLRSLDQMQDDEPSRAAGIETIFHPVPSVATRVANLASSKPNKGAWHAARMALPLSIAGLSLLSRAVHCNSGRPELWIMLPGD